MSHATIPIDPVEFLAAFFVAGFAVAAVGAALSGAASALGRASRLPSTRALRHAAR